jgi:hypothetical protein
LAKKKEKKRGAKGGIKHQPGRGHDTKSGPVKKRRIARKTAAKRRREEEAARQAWHAYDQLTDEQKWLLGPQGVPKWPRPKHED